MWSNREKKSTLIWLDTHFSRLLVERLLNTSLVPYTLSSEERMKKLYHLVGTIDDHATKAFVELQKSQLT